MIQPPFKKGILKTEKKGSDGIMDARTMLQKLMTTYTTNRSFSTGHQRWGWSPPHFFLYTNQFDS